MKKQVNLVILLLLVLSGLRAQQPVPLEYRLFELPDLIFSPIDPPKGFESAFELRIRQPLDHQDPSKGYFYQRAFLSHRGLEQAMVMATEGYGLPNNRLYEPTFLLEANQVDIEHRFFGVSHPDSLDYQYLTLEQATADLHHVRQLLGLIYKGPWVSTGISKGGQTSIFYRYFYPEDVAVSIPYVAPLNLELEEKRIYTFLDTVGTQACRDAIFGLQSRLLRERDQVLERLYWYARGAGLEFSYLSLEEAFEYAVLEYSFSFWQWGHKCEDIPGEEAPLDTALVHFLDVSNIDIFSDKVMKDYASHYYQAATQMGYYGYETERFKGLLKVLPLHPHPHAAFTPDKRALTFHGELTRQVAKWLEEEGNRFIYINGNSDTWSATAVRPSPGVDALWFFLPGKDHKKARIRYMNEAQQETLREALVRWLDMPVKGKIPLKIIY